MASRQKLGIILENKGFRKLKQSNDINIKKCAPKTIFINEKNYTLLFTFGILISKVPILKEVNFGKVKL